MSIDNSVEIPLQTADLSLDQEKSAKKYIQNKHSNLDHLKKLRMNPPEEEKQIEFDQEDGPPEPSDFDSTNSVSKTKYKCRNTQHYDDSDSQDCDSHEDEDEAPAGPK